MNGKKYISYKELKDALIKINGDANPENYYCYFNKSSEHEHYRCICGVPIINLYILTHKPTKKEVIIGSECQKNFEKLHKEFDTYECFLCKKFFKKKSKSFLCEECIEKSKILCGCGRRVSKGNIKKHKETKYHKKKIRRQKQK
jgi:hypothetical protein